MVDLISIPRAKIAPQALLKNKDMKKKSRKIFEVKY
jgi:hypothetical protein